MRNNTKHMIYTEVARALGTGALMGVMLYGTVLVFFAL